MKLNNRKLRELRVSRKIPLQEIANALGFKTAGGYLRVEKGENKLKAELLPLLAKIFNMKLSQFVDEIFFDNKLDESSIFNEEGCKTND